MQSGASPIFTPGNWNTYQTVTLAAAQDEDAVEGSATIRCSATEWESRDAIATEEDDDKILRVEITARPVEGDATVSDAGTVRAAGAPGSSVTVSLSSDREEVARPSEPTTITIPAGTTDPVSFSLEVGDDEVADGTQTATITASASGWSPGIGTVDVVDNEFEEGFERGDFTKYPWVLAGDAEWTVTPPDEEQHTGAHSACSGEIGDRQTTSIAVDVRLPDRGNITFWYRTFTQKKKDRLYFYVDGKRKGNPKKRSGEPKPRKPWVQEKKSHKIKKPGWHTFKWAYTKDKKKSVDPDCVWLDDIRFIRKGGKLTLQIATGEAPLGGIGVTRQTADVGASVAAQTDADGKVTFEGYDDDEFMGLEVRLPSDLARAGHVAATVTLDGMPMPGLGVELVAPTRKPRYLGETDEEGRYVLAEPLADDVTLRIGGDSQPEGLRIVLLTGDVSCEGVKAVLRQRRPPDRQDARPDKDCELALDEHDESRPATVEIRVPSRLLEAEKLAGIVSLDGVPLPGLNVALLDNRKERVSLGTTNAQGQFTLSNLPVLQRATILIEIPAQQAH